ncbi:sorting nexin-8-like isoform X1 [Argiope bruennichi]|uniref:Sorting nexin-8 like protein n=1 Tax=Argiope bruennichi TaxID=94029 RepID=A0A8T0FEF9_ARGBR|nr:sorting nexin-8-like isoform X1 [Argiope bruennichi]KAF8789697.1 Sorting nexin-8 like protein [Argiope bruennichi]
MQRTSDVTMAADLAFGNAPPYYRDMYDIVCPNQENIVDHDMFIKLLVKSSLPKQTLSQIWDLVDSRQGYLTRSGLYKALALVAFAQQGKPVSEKLLQNFAGEELPKPSLGDLTDLRILSIRLRREKNPMRLGLTYHEVCALDTVQVSLVPEKKGLFLKHVEYEVTSQRNKSVVQRRYNDFVALQELLLQKFPYRMIPQLPPKKVIGADDQFIEERRKSLKRFLNLLARHPVISEDKILHFFLTFSGTDVQHKMKDHFRGVLDEFNSNEQAKEAEELVPIDSTNQLAVVREQMKQVFSGFLQLREIAEKMVERSKQEASDMVLFGKELCSLANSASTESDWGSGGNETWDHLRTGMKNLHPMISNVSSAYMDLASGEEDDIVDELNLFLDILTAYKDLCDRYEQFSVSIRQKNANKLLPRRSSTNPIVIDAENQAIQQNEKRNNFFLHCIHMETQLVHTYMQILVKVLQSLVNLRTKGFSNISSLWKQMQPLVETMIPSPGATTPTSTISR